MTDDEAVDPRLIAELHARISALETWRAHQTDLLDELLEQRHDDLDDEPDTGLDSDGLIEWVHRCVTPVIARPLRGEIKWCPLWWEHPEAVFRFEALHRAWTELAPEPGAAMSIWIRDHLDPCLRELLSPLGPFVDCSHGDRHRTGHGHTPLPTLPTLAPIDQR